MFKLFFVSDVIKYNILVILAYSFLEVFMRTFDYLLICFY